jgi:hypothetical protein
VSTARSGVCARSSWTAANKADKAGEMHSTATARSGVCAAGEMRTKRTQPALGSVLRCTSRRSAVRC